jgi:DNA-binding CsgD family transcriptional regulator
MILTAFEVACCARAILGAEDAEIARCTGRSLVSVKQAMRAIYRKYGVQNRLQLTLVLEREKKLWMLTQDRVPLVDQRQREIFIDSHISTARCRI